MSNTFLNGTPGGHDGGSGGGAGSGDDGRDGTSHTLRCLKQHQSSATSTIKPPIPTMIPPTSSRRRPVSTVVGGVDRYSWRTPTSVLCAFGDSFVVTVTHPTALGLETPGLYGIGARLVRTNSATGIEQSSRPFSYVGHSVVSKMLQQ